MKAMLTALGSFIVVLPLSAHVCPLPKEQTRPISIEIGCGELVDKITILEIKSERIKNPDKLRNIEIELALLTASFNELLAAHPDLAEDLILLKNKLREINETLWDTENNIRAKEAVKRFDDEFIQSARDVYIHNDQRGQIKAHINALLSSLIVEEKQYTPY